MNVVDYGGVLALVPAPADPVLEARGLLTGAGSLADEVVEEHRREIEQDERRFC